jgi:hypothetical protein
MLVQATEIILELDISTGELLFEWASLDHVTPDGEYVYTVPCSNMFLTLRAEAVLPINPGQAGSGYNSSDAWDYFHINSVDKNADGDYLISARDACAVHKINGRTGEIVWRLNGKASSFKVPDDTKFCFQHHARFVARYDDAEIISLYDNSAHGTEDGRGDEVHTAPTSSGKIIKVNTTSWEAELVQAFLPPDGLLSKSQGSTQLLPNGNVLVNWGSEGAVTEFLHDGTPIFHAYIDSGYLGLGVENYRAFRYNWTGIPNEEPAIVALKGDEGASIYVSWNGDTQTKVWRFYAQTDEHGSKHFLGEVDKTSFETSFAIRDDASVTSVSAEAVDRSGTVLRVTRATSVEGEVLPPEAARDNFHPQPDDASRWAQYGIFRVMRVPQGGTELRK